MNTITLQDWQARHFAEYGAITVLVPMEPQPDKVETMSDYLEPYTIGEVVGTAVTDRDGKSTLHPHARVASVEYVDVRGVPSQIVVMDYGITNGPDKPHAWAVRLEATQ